MNICLVISLSKLIHYIYKWQDFFGALLGACVAVFIFVLTERVKSKNQRKDHLHLLHRSVGAALENLASIDKTIGSFSQNQLSQMIEQVQNDIDIGKPTICYGFVPLLHVFEINEELLRKSSGSGYVDIATIDLINKSKDLRKIIDDINRQFENTIIMNNEVVINRLNQDFRPQSSNFKKSLIAFKEQMLIRDFQSNVRIYATNLIKAQIAVTSLSEWGIRKWKKSFKTQEDIEPYFSKELNTRRLRYQESFHTQLTI